ncbi:ArnT family glycosyltransferase [Prochlorothrix hollandica]|uniref:Glycosyltransferase n=1 Tax=Prochlorothrix hollandica PCC 9006 = CALU 1027 TaxID=317619 RepID=A0A0M2PPW4_PROHO|nr:glycosyltransferase family 39 protein [Prochlorothrix hollandica]KKI98605.1 glycosyltransferase [Prochlorothrix hollandica PCC 9006 = CALU 1027]
MLRSSHDRSWILGLTLAALLLYCLNLGNLPLRDWDEGTYAQVAREIYRAGRWGWVHPTLWGEPDFTKPPLVHSLMALAYHWGGIHAWTSRLPGALFGAAAVPLLYGVGAALFPTRLPVRFGCLVYLTLMPVVRHGRLAMLDGAVVFFWLLLLLCLLRSRRHPPWALGVGLGFGLIVLTKGILGILLLGLALVFVLWDSPYGLRSPYLWGGIALGFLPAATWYGLQWQHYGQTFVEVALFNQNVDRIWETVENNDGPPWYYVVELLKYSWPWLLFLPWGLGRTWGDRHLSWAKLLLVWAGGYLATISVMGTKLPWYIFPLYPALALIIGVSLAHTWQSLGGSGGQPYTPQPVPQPWLWGLGILAGGAVAGMVYFSPGGGEPAPGLLLACGLISGSAGVSVVLARRGNGLFLPVLLWSWYLGLLLFVSSQHWVWELAEDYPVQPVAALVQQHTPPGAIVYTSHPHERPSLNFYSDRRVRSRPFEMLQNPPLANPGDPPVYWLVASPLLSQLSRPPAILGTTADWTLIQLQPPDSQP